MRCDQVRNSLTAYSLGVLDRSSSAVEQHMESCESCRRELALLTGVAALVERCHPPITSRRDLWPSISSQLSARRSRAWHGLFGMALRPAAIGLGALAALWIGLALGAHDGPQPIQGAPAVSSVALSGDDALLARWAHESQMVTGPTGPELAALTLASYSTSPPGGGAFAD